MGMRGTWTGCRRCRPRYPWKETTASGTRMASRGPSCCPWRRSGRPTRWARVPGSCRSWRSCQRLGSAANYCTSPGGRACWPGGRRVPADLVDQVLEWLADQSLLTFSLDGQTVMVHRLVAQVIRDGLARQRRLGAVCGSPHLCWKRTLSQWSDRRIVRRSAPPRAGDGAAGQPAELAEGVDEELAEILLRLRFISLYHLIELGDSVLQAIAVGEPLTADLERLLGPSHPDTLNARNSLAVACLAAGRVTDAIPLFERTLAVLVSQLGPDHPDTLTSQNNLASVYQDAGRAAEAIQLYELNLAERERVLGVDRPQHPDFPGQPRRRFSGRGPGGRRGPLLEQTLASRERVLSPDHPDTLTSRRNLAKAHQDTGRAADAVPLLEQTRPSGHESCAPITPRPHGVRHLPMPPRKRSRPASGGLPQARPGRCFRPASGGLPLTRPDRSARTTSRPAGQAARPFIAWPDPGRAAHRRRARPRGDRGESQTAAGRRAVGRAGAGRRTGPWPNEVLGRPVVR